MKITSFLVPGVAMVSLFSVGCSAAQLTGDRVMNSENGSLGHIYSFESDGNGFNTKNFFYDNGQEVVVFDTQFTPEIAKKSLDFIRTKTQNPITYVVVTHPNPDKFNGISVFQDKGARVVASRATSESMRGVHEYKKHYFVNIAKMFSEETYPQFSQVDIVFNHSYKLKLQNGEVIALTELASPGVSSNQTVAFVPPLNALMVGDLVHHKAHAWLEGGIVESKPTPSIAGWISDLEELKRKFVATNPQVYGGRGEVANLDQAVKSQIEYLKTADDIVSRYIAKLKDKKSELQGDQSGQHYSKIQGEFEKAFPGYGLSYMIQYGVYGLVNSKLQF